MPYTPFHFGPALLVKAAAPRRVSFLSFCTTQVAIDLESWYHLTNGDPHVHRILHTFLFGTLTGFAVGALVWILGAGVHAILGHRVATLSIGTPLPLFRPEVSVSGVALGGLFGGLTHAFLDGIMHRDVQPFRPLSIANPLFGLVGWDLLHAACVVAGIIGAMTLLVNRGSWRRGRDQSG